MIYYINESSSDQEKELSTITRFFSASIRNIQKKYDKKYHNNIKLILPNDIQNNIVGYFRLDKIKDLRSNDYSNILDMCNEIAEDCTDKIRNNHMDHYDELDCFRQGNQIVFKAR